MSCIHSCSLLGQLLNVQWIGIIIFEGFAIVDPSVYSPHPASYKSVFPNYIIALEAWRRTWPAERSKLGHQCCENVRFCFVFFKSVPLQATAEKTFDVRTEEAWPAGAVIGAS